MAQYKINDKQRQAKFQMKGWLVADIKAANGSIKSIKKLSKVRMRRQAKHEIQDALMMQVH